MTEIVYVLQNLAMPGLIKIGCAPSSDLEVRIRQLYSTGVPFPFTVFYACEVNDAKFVERHLHEAFDDHRVSKGREFFRLAPERARAALALAAIKEIKIGEQALVETPEIRAEVETAKRRSRFVFSMVGISPGTELQLQKDPAIICTTLDAVNQVNFKGDITSLSDAALQAIHSLGYEWSSASGPYEWAYHGKRLQDIRGEMEANAD